MLDSQSSSDNSFCVSGSKVRLLRNAKKCRANKNIRVNATEVDEEDADEANTRLGLARLGKKRLPVKLNVVNCENNQAINERLHRIRCTVDVEDFQRILSEVFEETIQEDDVLSKIHAEDIYQEHFGKYVERLKNATNCSSDAHALLFANKSE